MYSLDDYIFDLPKEQIAYYPEEKRDAARLMKVDVRSGSIEHRVFSDITEFFSPGDILDGTTSGRGENVHVFFYQVVSASAKTVTFRAVEKERVGHGVSWVPKKGAFTSPPKRKKIQRFSKCPTVETSLGHIWGRLWDGKPVSSHTDDRA